VDACFNSVPVTTTPRRHNGLIDKSPALIARSWAADIADALQLARAQGLEISVRGGGHNVAAAPR
jgi:FAD/FMN-containing dehydrogenase